MTKPDAQGARWGKLPNGKSYKLGGLKFYSYYTFGNGRCAIKTYREIHELVAKGDDLFELERGSENWKKLNRETGIFE